ncbi:MAG: phenylacetate-CoA oxygenase subunit PaaI [Acidobacteria bacterium]|nr:phenylacetate-CoA oxygenase subunit PaaI [Acidobacteriota bacterium]
MADTTTTELPKRFHDAVVKWRDTFLPDYGYLLENWDRFFPRDPKFRLCAYRECGMPCSIECGEDEGKPKHQKVADMKPEIAHQLAAQIRAQASTEFGSIQQHQLTLARAQDEQEQAMVLRMMAEELRHGYQMLHLLVEDDWQPVTGASSDQMIEEILSMRTGSHVLGAFNIDFESFVDNIVFCALIDRVGKYQLSMQKISSYSPMAESMPQMLREEAFHLATGVVPLRRWVVKAAEGSPMISMEVIQKHLNKWVPRALEMFGDERGGSTNVKWGLKPMKNREAQEQYRREVDKVVHDLNMRYLRARLPKLTLAEAEKALSGLEQDGGTFDGVRAEELLRVPHVDFFRRRGEPAFRMVGFDGETYEEVEAYLTHLTRMLPDGYRATRDFQDFVEAQTAVARGEKEPEEAQRQMPQLRRVGGVCPCSRAVRWVADEAVELPAPTAG